MPVCAEGAFRQIDYRTVERNRYGTEGGDQTTQSWLMSGLMNIYISSAGRASVRVTEGGAGGAGRQYGGAGAGNPSFSTAPNSPDATDRVDFQGRSIIVYRAFDSGARRVAIDLDGSVCTATVLNGKQSGKNIVQRQGRADRSRSPQSRL
jgi:hypothetical protein